MRAICCNCGRLYLLCGGECKLTDKDILDACCPYCGSIYKQRLSDKEKKPDD